MLHGFGLQFGRRFGPSGRARLAIFAIDAHLDQFVRLQATVDLFRTASREAVLADAGDGG
jgi:hypothetical protein